MFYRGIDTCNVVAVTSVDPKKSSVDEGEIGHNNQTSLTSSASGAAAAGEAMEPQEATDGELAIRCKLLIDSITKTVFNYVRRGVFESDKLTVATLLTVRIAVNDGRLQQEDVDYLINGLVSHEGSNNMGPLQEWMPPSIWPKIKALEGLRSFMGIGDIMQSDSDDWRKWFDSEMPEVTKLPGDYQFSLNSFDRLILLRAIRPDRVTTALKAFIEEMMGKEYVFQKPVSSLF